MQELQPDERQGVADGAAHQDEQPHHDRRIAAEERLPHIGDEAEDGQRDGADLTQEEDAAIGALDLPEDGGGVPVRRPEHPAEQEQSGDVGGGEGGEGQPAMGQGDVDRIEEAEAPQPGHRDGRRPENGSENRKLGHCAPCS